jgi:hypothetical protein
VPAGVITLAAGGLVASAGPAAADTAMINGASTFQTVTGFDASEAFGEAQTVMNASSSVQQQASACTTSFHRPPDPANGGVHPRRACGPAAGFRG